MPIMTISALVFLSFARRFNIVPMFVELLLITPSLLFVAKSQGYVFPVHQLRGDLVPVINFKEDVIHTRVVSSCSTTS